MVARQVADFVVQNKIQYSKIGIVKYTNHLSYKFLVSGAIALSNVARSGVAGHKLHQKLTRVKYQL